MTDSTPKLRPDLTIEQVMEYFQIGKSKVYRLIKAGVLKAYKIGNKGTRITIESIDELRNSGYTKSVGVQQKNT